jgi:plasmid stabilization system protein ParE
MATLNWTEEAERGLIEIFQYIAHDNPTAAANVVEGIYEKAQLLIAHPLLGYRHDTWPGREVRILLYGHYRIAYLVKLDKSLDVLGVFHGAMEIERYLK